MSQYIVLHGGRVKKRPHSHTRGSDTQRQDEEKCYDKQGKIRLSRKLEHVSAADAREEADLALSSKRI